MQNDTYAFVVRIWHEAQDEEGNVVAWRGSIEQVGSDKRFYFQDLDGIRRFIQERIGVNAKSTDPQRQSLLERIRHAWT